MSYIRVSPHHPPRAGRLVLGLLVGLSAGCTRSIPIPAVPAVPPAGTHALAFSPDGKVLATWDWENNVELRDAATGEVRTSFHGVGAPPLGMAVTPDGSRLATGHVESVVKLWDPAHPGAPAVLSGHQKAVTRLAFSPDGKTLASGSALILGRGSEWKLWDLGNEEARQAGIDRGQINSLAFAPDGKRFAAGLYGNAKLWEVATGKDVAEFAVDREDNVTALAFSPDGRRLALGTDSGVILVFLVAGKEPPLRSLGGHTQPVEALSFSPDGKTLASGGSDKTARLWDAADLRPKHVLQGQPAAVKGVAFSPDGAVLATAGADKSLKHWNVETGQEASSRP